MGIEEICTRTRIKKEVCCSANLFFVSPALSVPVAERQALEPVLSQNITQSQMPINNQLITIIIKSKYYRISLAIS
ncbi:hypothetical protein, partial [Millionella massiliensis]|uniref:hypothetical protein n=1 Tax=Millionella massiliensis TaxID=1871023 RepID=UPI0023A87C48